jgi:hypothetical protein
VQVPDARVEPLTSAGTSITYSEGRSGYLTVLQLTDVSSPVGLDWQIGQNIINCGIPDALTVRSTAQDALANDVGVVSPGTDCAVRR